MSPTPAYLPVTVSKTIALFSCLFLSVMATSTAGANEGVEPDRAKSYVSYVVPRDDGYGLSECMIGGTACARAVADAWCKSHGNGPSVFIGEASDVTRALIQPSKVELPANSVIVRCRA